MSATTVINGILSTIQADPSILSEFGLPNIKKGIETNFDVNAATKGVRVATEFSRQRRSAMTSNTKVDAWYGYTLLAYFYEADAQKVDERMTQYNEIMRAPIDKKPDLGVGVLDVIMAQTLYRKSVKIPNLYFCIFPLVCRAREVIP